MLGRDGPQLARRWQHEGAFGHGRAAFVVQKAHQRLAHGQFGDGRFNVQPRLLAHGLRRGFDGLLVTWGEGAQCVLHAVAQLGQHAVGNVQRVLGDEVHAHTFGAHQPYYQLNALNQCLGRIGEQQVGLVEEEHQFGFVQVAHLWQGFKQLTQHPQQKGGVQLGRVHQLVGRQDVDHAQPAIGLHEVGNVQHGLAKEHVAALFFHLHQRALDGSDAGRADVAVFGGEVFGVVAHVLAHGTQVFHVQQQHAAVVGHLEHQLQHARLGVVQVEHAAEQQRPQVAHGGAHRVALLAKHVPQRHRKRLGLWYLQFAFGQYLGQFVAHLAGLRYTGQVAFDVGHEHGHALA